VLGKCASGGSKYFHEIRIQKSRECNDRPSWRYAGASSPRAEVVSFASRSVPRLRMALRRASARAAADIVVQIRRGKDDDMISFPVFG